MIFYCNVLKHIANIFFLNKYIIHVIFNIQITNNIKIPDNVNHQIFFDDNNDIYNPFSSKNLVLNHNLIINDNELIEFNNSCYEYKIQCDLHNNYFDIINKFIFNDISKMLSLDSIIDSIITKEFFKFKKYLNTRTLYFLFKCNIYHNYEMLIYVESLIFISAFSEHVITNTILKITVRHL